jgi:inosose dehydratase
MEDPAMARTIKMGCQTYTWQMSYEKYSNQLDHILDVVKSAGFAGIEPEVCMLGPYADRPEELAAGLKHRGLELGALCLVCDWRGPEESAQERQEADRAMDYLKRFPGTLLALCQMPGRDRFDLARRQRNGIACCNAIGRRTAEAGIAAAFHPNSPAGSIFRVEEDYKVLLDGLDGRFVGFAPDAGHIAKAGMDVLEIFRRYRSAIRHVHFKDMSADWKWAEMGQGVIDFPGIIADLRAGGYTGWIMVEDESPRAELFPDEVTIDNGRYVNINTGCSLG